MSFIHLVVTYFQVFPVLRQYDLIFSVSISYKIIYVRFEADDKYSVKMSSNRSDENTIL